jgi:hypothetical protein
MGHPGACLTSNSVIAMPHELIRLLVSRGHRSFQAFGGRYIRSSRRILSPTASNMAANYCRLAGNGTAAYTPSNPGHGICLRRARIVAFFGRNIALGCHCSQPRGYQCANNRVGCRVAGNAAMYRRSSWSLSSFARLPLPLGVMVGRQIYIREHILHRP